MTKEARIYNGEKTASLVNGVQKTGQLHVKESNQITFSDHIQINSKWIKHLNIVSEMIKLEENIGSTLFDFRLQHYFLDKFPRAMEIKIIKQNLIKLKTFAQQRKPYTERQSTEWKKIQVVISLTLVLGKFISDLTPQGRTARTKIKK